MIDFLLSGPGHCHGPLSTGGAGPLPGGRRPLQARGGHYNAELSHSESGGVGQGKTPIHFHTSWGCCECN